MKAQRTGRPDGAPQDNEARNRSIIDAAMDGFWLATPEGRLLEVNETYCRMSGYTREELLALTIPDLVVTVGHGDPSQSPLVAQIRERGEGRFETRHRRKDGTIFDVEVSAQYREADAQLIVFLRDITERKAAAEALRASEARYRSMLDTSPDAVGLTDLQGRIRMASPAALRLVRCERPEDLLGRPVTDLLVPEDRERAMERMAEILNGRPPSPTEYTGVRFDGSKVAIEVNSQFIRGADGRPTEMILLIRDITARKEAAEALLASEERHRIIIETAMDGFWLTDREGRLLEVNDAYCRMSGYSAAELRAMSLSELKAPEVREELPGHIQRAMEHGEARFETRHRRKDGSLFDLEVSIQYRPQEGGRFVAFQRDITGRKRAEEALRLSEGRYRSILNASPDNITITDLEAKIVMVSPGGLETMGYDRSADLGGRPLSDFIAEEDQPRATANIALMFQGVFTGPEPYKARRADGSLVDVEVNGEFIRDASGQPTQIVFIARNITERKRAQDALLSSETRHRTILQTAMDGFWLVDREGRLLDVNEAYCRMSGYTAAELLSMKVGDLSVRDTGPGVAAHIQSIMDQGSERFESEHRRKDGSTFSVEASVQYLPFEGGRLVAFLRDVTEQKRAVAALQQSHDMIAKLTAQVPGVVYQYRLYPDGRSCFPFASPGMRDIYEVAPEEVKEDATAVFGRLHPEDHDRVSGLILESARTLASFHCEFRVILPHQGLRWRLCDAMPERMADGGTLWHGIISDITGRKQADETLRLSLKEKEGLLREVHHRVKNNLQVITSLLRLETSRSEAADTKRVLRDMQGRILSMAVLHETLYRTGRFGQVDLGGYLRQLAQQLFRATGSGARLDLDLAAVPVEIDQAIPCGLIVNELLTNSLKHAFAEGTPGEVKVSLDQNGPGSEARLTVIDTGVGLPLDFESRRGRSLGLQLVTDLVRQISGRLAIEPGPGAGFVVTFMPALSHATISIPRPAEGP